MGRDRKVGRDLTVCYKWVESRPQSVLLVVVLPTYIVQLNSVNRDWDNEKSWLIEMIKRENSDNWKIGPFAIWTVVQVNFRNTVLRICRMCRGVAIEVGPKHGGKKNPSVPNFSPLPTPLANLPPRCC